MNSVFRPAASFIDLPAMVWNCAALAAPEDTQAACSLSSEMAPMRGENDAM